MKMIWILMLSLSAMAHAEGELTLTLEDSISIAQKSASAVLKADQDRELSATTLTQSYLQFLPNLTAQGGYNYLKGTTFLTSSTPTVVKGSNYGPSYQISTALNLFNGLGDLAALKAATTRRHAAQESALRARQQISLDITQSFLQVILDQKLIEIAEKNLKASRDRQLLLEEQTKVGVRNLSDLFRQQAQTSTDESFYISQQNKRQTDLILLLRKLRIDPEKKYSLVEPPLEQRIEKLQQGSALGEEGQLIQQALERRQDYDASKRVADASLWDVTTSRAGYFPRLDFVATYGATARHFDSQVVNDLDQTPATQPSFGDQLHNRASYTYGLLLTWNIFDRWATTLSVERAKTAAFRAQLDAEDFRNQVTGEVKQSISDLNAAVKQLEASQKGLVAARKAFDVSQGRYEVGALSFVDLATAQTTLVQVEANRAQALVGYELQKRAVDFALGTTPTE